MKFSAVVFAGGLSLATLMLVGCDDPDKRVAECRAVGLIGEAEAGECRKSKQDADKMMAGPNLCLASIRQALANPETMQAPQTTKIQSADFTNAFMQLASNTRASQALVRINCLRQVGDPNASERVNECVSVYSRGQLEARLKVVDDIRAKIAKAAELGPDPTMENYRLRVRGDTKVGNVATVNYFCAVIRGESIAFTPE